MRFGKHVALAGAALALGLGGIGPAQSVSYTIEDDGEYWGAGLRLDGQAAGLRLQYTRYFDESDVEIEGYPVGVNVYF